jgi:hypothetical protein
MLETDFYIGAISDLERDYMEECMEAAIASEIAAPPLDYGAWLKQGKELAREHNNRQWLLGDWVNEGDDEYNAKNLGIPSYLLIGSHPPNFWKDVSAATDLSVNTLKGLGLVARRFPASKRIPELSWSHHHLCAPYERRFEYLEAALMPGTTKHHTLEWLAEHIAEQEGEPEKREQRSVPLRLPLDLIQKLKDLARYHGKHVDKLIYDVCAHELFKYIQTQERELSLEIYGMYDKEGLWPFSAAAKIHYQPKPKRRRAA